MVRFYIRVSGRVQGVGFRWFTSMTASRLDLTGWVRNREDGVEFWFELDGGNGVKSRGAEKPGQAGLPETAGR